MKASWGIVVSIAVYAAFLGVMLVMYRAFAKQIAAAASEAGVRYSSPQGS